jgi:hypothetical protein
MANVPATPSRRTLGSMFIEWRRAQIPSTAPAAGQHHLREPIRHTNTLRGHRIARLLREFEPLFATDQQSEPVTDGGGMNRHVRGLRALKGSSQQTRRPIRGSVQRCDACGDHLRENGRPGHPLRDKPLRELPRLGASGPADHGVGGRRENSARQDEVRVRAHVLHAEKEALLQFRPIPLHAFIRARPGPDIEVYICLREQGPVVLKVEATRGPRSHCPTDLGARRLDLVDDQPAQFE